MFRLVVTGVAALALSACAQAGEVGARAQLETAASTPDAASAGSQELLNRMAGRWVLTGTIAGQETTHDVEADWTLQRTYMRINEVSRERGDNGLPAYEATIYVGWLNDHYVCIWLDNTEVASGEVTCTAAETPDVIPFVFRDAQGRIIFINTFTYDRAVDSWEWRMDNIRDGQPVTFGLVTLRRP